MRYGLRWASLVFARQVSIGPFRTNFVAPWPAGFLFRPEQRCGYALSPPVNVHKKRHGSHGRNSGFTQLHSMVIFHSYVSLPEGTHQQKGWFVGSKRAWPCLGLEEPARGTAKHIHVKTCTHQDATLLHVHLHSHPISLSSATESLLSRTLHATPLKVHLDTSMHKHAIHATLLKVHVHTLHVTLLKIHLHLNTRLMLRVTWVSLSSSAQQPERDSGKMHPDETNMRFLHRRWEEYKQEQRKSIEKRLVFKNGLHE